MADLRLAKLPDRTPVRVIITVSSSLNAALRDYAAVYRVTYGQAETVAELIPFMLESFLAADRGFAQARKEAPRGEAIEAPSRRHRTGKFVASEDGGEGA